MAGTTQYFGISYPTATDYVKDGASAMQTIADGFDSAVAIPTYNNQTGTSYTFVLTDAGKTVTSNNASAVTFTIPPQASVAWANNTTLTVRNLGAGVVTIAGGSGVTVTNTAQTVAQYGEVKLIRTASNAWTVVPASGGASGLTLISSHTLSASSGQVITGLTAGSRYRILINCYGSNNGEIITVRFREGSTDKTSNYYGGSFRSAYDGGTGSFLPSNNSAQMFLAYYTTNTNFDALVSFDFWINPSGDVAGITGTALSEFGSNAVFFAFNNRNMSACDGINIYPAGGNFTGKLSIYKYQD